MTATSSSRTKQAVPRRVEPSARANGRSIRSTVAFITFLLAGIYILAQPFAVSPLGCLRAFPGFSLPERVVTCLTSPPTWVAFNAGLAVGGAVIAIAIWSLLRKS